MNNTSVSPKKTARIAGLFYLLNAVAGGFYLGYVRDNLIIYKDVALTASNLMEHEQLFRLGIFSNILSQVFFLLFGLMLFFLFRESDRRLSTMLLAFNIIIVALTVINTLNNYGAIMVLHNDAFKVFEQEKLNALMMMFLRLNNYGQGVLEVFWTPWYFVLGLLIIKSGYLPKIFGILYVISSVTFLMNTFTALAMPQYHYPIFFQIAITFGALCNIPAMFWLLIKGAKTNTLQTN